MAKKSTKSKKTTKNQPPTWQQIAEAQKPLSQKAIELLNDPTKHLITPNEEKWVNKEIKIKTQPNPTHIIVTELSEPRRIQAAEDMPPKKALKAEIVARETRSLTPEEVAQLKLAIQGASQAQKQQEDDDEPFKPVVDVAKKVIKLLTRKKPDIK